MAVDGLALGADLERMRIRIGELETQMAEVLGWREPFDYWRENARPLVERVERLEVAAHDHAEPEPEPEAESETPPPEPEPEAPAPEPEPEPEPETPPKRVHPLHRRIGRRD